MTSLVSLGKALSDPTRVRILNVLLQTELCVCELVDVLQVGQSSLSTHLQALRYGGVVATERRRTWIIYSISPQFREPLTALFTVLPQEDQKLSEDNHRLMHRIRLRVDGCCVVGFAKEVKDEVANNN